MSIDNYYGEKKVANIGLQDFEGGYAMGKFLAEQGHKNILFLADNDVGVDHERWLGVQRQWKSTGRRRRGRAQNHAGEPGTAESVAGRQLEDLKSRDVLFFASDFYALEAIHFLQDKGVDIPGDVSVAGFDDSPMRRSADRR